MNLSELKSKSKLKLWQKFEMRKKMSLKVWIQTRTETLNSFLDDFQETERDEKLVNSASLACFEPFKIFLQKIPNLKEFGTAWQNT